MVASAAVSFAFLATAWTPADAASTITIHVTQKNKPLAGAKVVQTVNGTKTAEEKTNEHGAAVFTIHAAGEHCWTASIVSFGKYDSNKLCRHPVPAGLTIAL